MKKFLLALLLTAFCQAAGFHALAFDGDEKPEIKYNPLILTVENDEEASELESQGVIFWHRRGDLALALVPLQQPETRNKVRTRDSNRTLMPKVAMPTMDIAKTHFDAISIQTGKDLPSPYTGEGVVVGFCDIGFDPHHVNFLGPDGKTRVKKLIYYDEPAGVRKILNSEDEIGAWVTDRGNDTHATHVAGIMAGSYFDNGYSGMAPGAEIVAATSRLYDVGILSACEEIISYAKSVGKPAVINLSIGSYNGPHDGSSLFNRYMAMLGEEAIICISAGNEGASGNSHRITFGPSNPSWKVRIHSTDWVQFDMYGLTDVWSSDARPVSVKFHIHDGVTQESVYESDWIGASTQFPVSINSDEDAEFAKYFSGEIYIEGGINDDNGRWFTEVYYDAHTDIGNPNADNKWARYTLGLEYTGEHGVTADITADCQYSKLAAWAGAAGPNSGISISDIATGDNVICVGMYKNRSEIPQLDGTFTPTGYEAMMIHPSSGNGVLVDGRVLPHSVAPGASVISSANSNYVEMNPDRLSNMNAKATVGGRTYYWNVNSGTSMSTPYLAGVVASWLEADPTLDINNVKKILEETNNKDCYDAADPRNGKGWLQPYEGLKAVIKNSTGISGSLDSDKIRVIISGDKAEILNPSSSMIKACVYSLDGRNAMSPFVSDSQVSEISLNHLSKGVYIITVEGDGLNPIQRKFVR